MFTGTCYVAGVVLGTRDTEMDKIKLPFRCSGEKTDKHINMSHNDLSVEKQYK